MSRKVAVVLTFLIVALLVGGVSPSSALAASAPVGFRLPFVGGYSIGTGPCAQHASSIYPSNREALDFVMPSGTAVIATAAGIIQNIWDSGGGGNVALISHANGIKSVYAHLSAFKLSSGSQVAKGQLIALSGNSGSASTGAHLHFAVLSGSTSTRNLSGSPVWIRDLPGITWTSNDPNRPCAPAGVADGFARGASGDGNLLMVLSSNQCMDVSYGSRTDGADVIQWPCHSGNNQRWAVEPSTTGYFRIVNINSGKCLDVEGGYLGNGGDIIQWRCHGGDNQSWARRGTNPFQWVNKRSGKCIDVSGASLANGADVIQWSCHTGTNQKWLIR